VTPPNAALAPWYAEILEEAHPPALRLVGRNAPGPPTLGDGGLAAIMGLSAAPVLVAVAGRASAVSFARAPSDAAAFTIATPGDGGGHPVGPARVPRPTGVPRQALEPWRHSRRSARDCTSTCRLGDR
jgi:hypothetical protein